MSKNRLMSKNNTGLPAADPAGKNIKMKISDVIVRTKKQVLSKAQLLTSSLSSSICLDPTPK